MSSNMCAVSVIYDMFGKQPDSWYTPQRIDLFRSMVTDAMKFDIEADQPDCQDPEKAKLEERNRQSIILNYEVNRPEN
jgi:hypothetical protein